mmetsp:Transcript_8699/g.16991  ORF Transcript_8699/g.16991 Transcript_8699/m.16991 type:complete len:466 (-) Transcript_8699:2378-3775(-)
MVRGNEKSGGNELLKELQAEQERERAKTDERSILQDQMKKLEQSLKEINSDITGMNKQIRMHREERESVHVVKRKPVTEMEQERVRQERDNAIKELLIRMSDRALPLKNFETRVIEATIDPPTLHTVKVKYAKGVRDGDLDRLKSSVTYELPVRITKETTFYELKDFAMKFWNIESESMIDLRAPNFAHLNLVTSSVKVHDLIVEQRSIPEFWLIEVNSSARNLLDEEEQFYADPKQASSVKENPTAAQHSTAKSDLGKAKNYDKFMKQYYGMEGYIPSKIQKEPPPVDKHDTSCVTGTILLLLLILTIFVMTTRRAVEDSYWLTQMIRAKLFNEYNYDKTELSVADTYQLNDFIINNLAYSILQSTEDPHITINDKCLIIGPVRLRILRTKTADCKGDTFDQDITCYEASYNDDNRNETDIYVNEEFSLPFQEASDNDIDSIIIGDFSNYDGSGNTFDINTNDT